MTDTKLLERADHLLAQFEKTSDESSLCKLLAELVYDMQLDIEERQWRPESTYSTSAVVLYHPVLVRLYRRSDTQQTVSVGYKILGRWLCGFGKWRFADSGYRVTHWMPLPEMPE